MTVGYAMTRRGFIRAAGAAGLAAHLAGRFGPARAARLAEQVGAGLPDTTRMNVLIFDMEDWTANAVGCYGNSVPKTPNIDRLAAGGTRFNRMYIQYPCCNPSRSSFWTGLRPPTTGMLSNAMNMMQKLPPGTQSLPQLMKAAGFYTACIGKLFHTVDQSEPHMMTFDRIEHSARPQGWNGPDPVLEFPPAKGRDPVGPPPKGAKKGTPEYNKWRSKHSDRYGDCGLDEEETDDRRYSRTAVKLLEEFARDQRRFCLFVGSKRPHTPLICPKKYLDLYDPDKIPAPAAPPEKDQGVPDVARKFGKSADIFTSRKATPQETREAIAAYYACASFVDAGIGLVLEALERTGLADKTIVIFFGDHGFHLGEHGLWSKYTLFEPVTRIPFIVRVPGVPACGKVIDAITEMVDLVPSLCDLSGLKTTNPLEGTSWAPLLADPNRPWKKAAFSWFGNQGENRSVRTRQYKYAEWPYKGETFKELYDLQADPWETVNLAGKPAYAKVQAEHAALLKAGWKAALPEGAS